MYVEEEHRYEGNGDECSDPTHDEHYEYAQQSPDKTQPHRVVMERRPPACNTQIHSVV